MDQYIWSILQALGASDADEVTIDSAANWKPTKNVPGCKVCTLPTDTCTTQAYIDVMGKVPILAEIIGMIGYKWEFVKIFVEKNVRLMKIWT